MDIETHEREKKILGTENAMSILQQEYTSHDPAEPSLPQYISTKAQPTQKQSMTPKKKLSNIRKQIQQASSNQSGKIQTYFQIDNKTVFPHNFKIQHPQLSNFMSSDSQKQSPSSGTKNSLQSKQSKVDIYRSIVNKFKQFERQNPTTQIDFQMIQDNIPDTLAFNSLKELCLMMNKSRNYIFSKKSPSKKQTLGKRTREQATEEQSKIANKVKDFTFKMLKVDETFANQPRELNLINSFFKIQHGNPRYFQECEKVSQSFVTYYKDQYIDFYLGTTDKPLDQNLMISEEEKLSLWVQSANKLSNDIIISRTTQIGDELHRLLTVVEPNYALLHPQQQKIEVLLSLMRNNSNFNDRLNYPLGYIALLISQRLVHTILKPIVKLQGTEQVTEWLSDPTLDVPQTTLKFAKLLILGKFASRHTVLHLIQNADNLLYDESLHQLQNNQHQDGYYKLLNQIHKTQTNPNTLINNIKESSKGLEYMWSQLALDQKVHGMNSEKFQLLIKVLKGRDVALGTELLQNMTVIAEGIAQVKINQAARIEVDDKQLDQEAVWVQAQLVNNKDELDKMIVISEKFEKACQDRDKDYKHRLRLVYFAVRAVLVKEKVVLMQAPTGVGKTWINLLFADYVQTHLGRKVIYCTINNALTTQCKKLAKKVNLDLIFCMPEELNTYLDDGQDWHFIIDEYYELLKTSKLNHDVYDMVPGVFTVGSEHRLLAATAHNSAEFKRGFLLKRFASVNIELCFDDIFPFKKEENLTDVKVQCSNDINQLQDKLISYIETESEIRPVIVFGINDGKYDSVRKRIKLNHPSDLLQNDNDVQIIQGKYEMKERGVVYFSNKYKIGINIKFLTTAAVAIYCENKNSHPDREELFQMVGRGQRAGGNYIGCVFSHYAEGNEDDVERTIKQSSTLDFQNGAAILRIIEDVQSTLETFDAARKQSWRDFTNLYGSDWKLPFTKFLGKIQNQKLKEKFAERFKALPCLNKLQMK